MTDPEARELFDRVRSAYNRMRQPGALPIPPFEEWQGVSPICSSPLCRCAAIVPMLFGVVKDFALTSYFALKKALVTKNDFPIPEVSLDAFLFSWSLRHGYFSMVCYINVVFHLSQNIIHWKERLLLWVH